MNPVSSSDLHPDANSLNAFVERVLPKPEYRRVLAHIADCERCRHVVHLVQDATPAEELGGQQAASLPIPSFWGEHGFTGRKFGWMTAAAICGMVAVTFLLHQRHTAPISQLPISSPPPVASATSQRLPGSTNPETNPNVEKRSPSEATTPVDEPAPSPVAAKVPEESPALPAPTVSSPDLLPRAETSIQKEVATSTEVNPANSASSPKKRIAVLDFNDAAVKPSVEAVYGANQNVGMGITALLTQKLVKDGTYTVVDHDAVTRILHEQNVGNPDPLDASSAVKIGKLLGVDEVIIGAISSFGRDDQRRITGAGGTAFGINKALSSGQRAKVILNARIIDVNTGEIEKTFVGTGSSQISTFSGLSSSSSLRRENSTLNMDSPDFEATTIGRAVKSAIAELGTQLDAASAKLPVKASSGLVLGLVTNATGEELVINVGLSQGVKLGDTLNVIRLSGVIKDPATGAPLRSIETLIGTVTITGVEATTARGIFIGSISAQAGDTVRLR